jgi:hypothetical protein
MGGASWVVRDIPMGPGDFLLVLAPAERGPDDHRVIAPEKRNRNAPEIHRNGDAAAPQEVERHSSDTRAGVPGRVSG